MVKSLSDSLLGRARLGRVRADRGEVPEWSNGAVSKTVVLVTVPRVRIPVSPPLIIMRFFNPIFLHPSGPRVTNDND
jgi:hypothetical protein